MTALPAGRAAGRAREACLDASLRARTRGRAGATIGCLTPVRGPPYHPPDDERAMRRCALLARLVPPGVMQFDQAPRPDGEDPVQSR
jgi:hypothetical protein